jgi:hypothetical protein
LFLGIDFLAVDHDLEHAAACGNELQRTDILFEPEKFFRQTDGLRLIVSHAAIFDRNL